MKKVLLVLWLAVVSGALLTGCKKKAPVVDTPITEVTPPTTANEDGVGTTTLTIIDPNAPGESTLTVEGDAAATETNVEVAEGDAGMETNVAVTEDAEGDAGMETNVAVTEGDEGMETNVEVASAGSYVAYEGQSQIDELLTAGKKVVFFFHAGRCPSCVASDEALTADGASLSDGVVVIKADYDTADELKEGYGVVSQHTFVLIGADRSEVAKDESGLATVEDINTFVADNS